MSPGRRSWPGRPGFSGQIVVNSAIPTYQHHRGLPPCGGANTTGSLFILHASPCHSACKMQHYGNRWSPCPSTWLKGPPSITYSRSSGWPQSGPKDRLLLAFQTVEGHVILPYAQWVRPWSIGKQPLSSPHGYVNNCRF